MNSFGPGGQSTLITVVIVLIVVARFLMRELRARRVRVRTLWIRPALLVVMLLLLIAATFAIPGVSLPPIVVSVLIGAAVGVVTGALVVRSTTFAAAGERGTVIARGSITTVVIWIVALALRFLVRFAFAGAGADQAEQFELNVGLVSLVAAAFIIVALGMHRAIDRLAPEAPGAVAP